MKEPTPIEEVIPPTSTQNSQASSDYLDALSSITKSNFDDGILGINHTTQLFHGMPFTVTDANLLNIQTPTGLVSLKIPSKEVWQLLLAKNPNKLSIPLYQSNNLPTPALRNYRLIAKKLDLLERTREECFDNAAHKTAIQRRENISCFIQERAVHPVRNHTSSVRLKNVDQSCFRKQFPAILRD